MAIVCRTLSKSKKLQCNKSVAGVRAISFGLYDPMNRIVTTTNGVVDLTTYYGADTLSRFEVKSTTSKYLENRTTGEDTRSTNIKGTFPLMLAIPPDATERIEVAKIEKTLADRQWVCFIEYKDGSIVAIGTQNGADVLTSDSDSGATATDRNGFMVTITTDEPDYASLYTLTGDALVDYAAALMAY